MLQDNHLAYDMLGRLRSSADNRALITFEYDAEGNRTRVKTHVRVDAVGDDDVETLKDEDRYFAYDAMNRQVLVDGYADGTIGQRGHQLGYDLNGNRTSDISWGNKVTVGGGQTLIGAYNQYGQAIYTYQAPPTYTVAQGTTTEQYSYDALGRLQGVERDGVQIDLRYYDGAGRLVQSAPNLPGGYAEALNAGVAEADRIGFELRRYRYDANGQLRVQRNYGSAGTILKSDIVYEGTSDGMTLGYDEAGNVIGYRFSNFLDGYRNTTSVTHKLFEGYVDNQRDTVSTQFQAGTSTSQYDANGFLVGIDDATENTLDRSIANDASGRALRVTQSGNTLYSLIVNGEMFGRHGVAPNEVDPRTASGQAQFAQVAEFEFGYRRITGSYPAPGVGQYTVRQGDNLQSIAQAAYGDSRLWWRIAQANGLNSDTDLRVGQTLTLPSQVAGSSNNSATFKPYDPSEIVGDTSPNLPKPQGDDGCGPLGQILMIVVAVAVTYLTAGATANAMGVAMTELSAGSVAVGAASAAVGAVASQAVGIAIGAQDDFNWKGVALAAISGGVTAGVTGAFYGSTSALNNVVVKAAISNAMSQGIGVVTGLQDHFSWTAVAASAVGAGVGSAVGDAVRGALPANMDAFAQKLVVGTAAGMSAGVTTALLRGGRVSVQQVAVDAFGNALGQGLVDSMQSAPDQSDAEWQRLKRYEGAAVEQEAANNRTSLNAFNRENTPCYRAPTYDNWPDATGAEKARLDRYESKARFLDNAAKVWAAEDAASAKAALAQQHRGADAYRRELADAAQRGKWDAMQTGAWSGRTGEGQPVWHVGAQPMAAAVSGGDNRSVLIAAAALGGEFSVLSADLPPDIASGYAGPAGAIVRDPVGSVVGLGKSVYNNTIGGLAGMAAKGGAYLEAGDMLWSGAVLSIDTRQDAMALMRAGQVGEQLILTQPKGEGQVVGMAVGNTSFAMAATAGAVQGGVGLYNDWRLASLSGDAVETGWLGGKLYDPNKLEQLGRYLERRGVTLKVGDEHLPPGLSGAFARDGSELILGSNPTEYVVWHELSHFRQYQQVGPEAYMALPRGRDYNAPEQFVFDMLENSPKRWNALTFEEQQHAIGYIERVGGMR